jgi:hypothetical protein
MFGGRVFSKSYNMGSWKCRVCSSDRENTEEINIAF